jgi:hypothetical protein
VITLGSHDDRASTLDPITARRSAERNRLHGKEGVDGSSPSEGSAKTPHVGNFALRVQTDLLFVARAVGMEPFMELCRTRVELVRVKEECFIGLLFAAHRNALAVLRALVRLWSPQAGR